MLRQSRFHGCLQITLGSLHKGCKRAKYCLPFSSYFYLRPDLCQQWKAGGAWPCYPLSRSLTQLSTWRSAEKSVPGEPPVSQLSDAAFFPRPGELLDWDWMLSVPNPSSPILLIRAGKKWNQLVLVSSKSGNTPWLDFLRFSIAPRQVLQNQLCLLDLQSVMGEVFFKTKGGGSLEKPW